MTGDQADIAGRIKAVLPRWFGPASPLLDALLQGLANGAAFVYTLYLYAKLQTRILTATDGWLDMIAADFFGTNVLRAANQSDASYRAAIIANMFRERATRNAITLVLKALTGRAPVIVEPQRPADTGVYGASVQVSQPGVTTFIDTTGALVYAPPNTPRYQNNQLLIEAASTNLLLMSEQLTDAKWVGTVAGTGVAPIVTGGFTSPRGDLTASRVQLNIAGGITAGDISQLAGFGVSLTIGAAYTQSIWLRTNDGSTKTVGIVSVTGGVGFVIVTPAWQRFSVTASAITTSGNGFRLRLSGGMGNATADLLAWGGQTEAGTTPSSYIPTTTAAVTRAADALLNAGSGAGGAAYGSAGAYGSMLLPYQAFVTAFRPLASGVPNVAGYGISSAGYGVASQGEYVSITSVTGAVQDADINSAVDLVKPAATTLWLRISS